MRSTLVGCLGAAVLFGLVGGAQPGAAKGDRERSSAGAGTAITRGVAFLQDDAVRWKASKQCATCHHGTMTLWALNEAKRQGYAVDPAALADVEKWTKERFLAGLDQPRDPRPGWAMINTSALFLSAMAHNQPEMRTVPPETLKQIAEHAGRHLEEDGSVLTPATMSPPRPQNGPPPVFESREVLTLLAVLAMLPEEPSQPTDESPVRAARKKASAWLADITPGSDTQAKDLRLLLAVQEGKPKTDIRAAIAGILARQNEDGGWGQTPELKSDAFATGQTLYALSLAGVDRRRPEIQRAAAFLASRQRPDGSWPMSSRAHPGAAAYTHPEPVIHFGSCWAVLGLSRSVPAPRSASAH
jgi:hypothetical protein